MNPFATRSAPEFNIAAAERDTGLSKDTLRVWERRYGFPSPRRDAGGERLYSSQEIEQLRVLKRLVDAGERPGRLMSLSMAELVERLQRHAPTAASDTPRELGDFLEILKSHDVQGLRRQLIQARERLGLARFVIDVVGPLNTRVGDAWMRGQLQIFEEHLYTESIQVVLRDAIPCSTPNCSSNSKPSAGTWTRTSPGTVRCQQAQRRAGADHQDERHHRVGGAAGHRDVPARQPRRQRLLGLHVVWFFEEQKHSLVLMEYLRRFRPDLVPTEEELHEVRFEFDPAPGAGDADAALLRRDPAEPLVPPRRRMAHRAGHQAHLRDAGAGRGPPRRRLPALHEARDDRSSATRPRPPSPRSAC
jgi:DNA-binding transcriptional MerR regulator